MDTAKDFSTFLKDRRQRLDPAALGFTGRRRTPGLRREEVAARANISTTWYTWLEQGRGGAPSARVLESLASALMLTEAERDYLFLIGIGRPARAGTAAPEGVAPRLQRVLDALPLIPALVATSSWDVIGWNQAARRVLTDYDLLPPGERNILRLMFLDSQTQAAQSDWALTARYLVATFRAETARAGHNPRAADLLAELSANSEAFVRLWKENDVLRPGEGTKTILKPKVGEVCLEFSSFAVDGRPDLKLMIYNPASDADREKIEQLCS
ncbi:putative transcriptional regulator [Hyphomonas neptunium ATCC 15444]|uniref:Putative transcriptional regulator n=2 Tax=Hyphomonas TaxID=85 RepID=Q0C018_HYPNA|nr:putative transcriptional regulator [Hyphomonas neptunium ATCC 15444]